MGGEALASAPRSHPPLRGSIDHDCICVPDRPRTRRGAGDQPSVRGAPPQPLTSAWTPPPCWRPGQASPALGPCWEGPHGGQAGLGPGAPREPVPRVLRLLRVAGLWFSSWELGSPSAGPASASGDGGERGGGLPCEHVSTSPKRDLRSTLSFVIVQSKVWTQLFWSSAIVFPFFGPSIL